MCIIILNKKGLIDRDILVECNLNNPDGNGLMYSVNDKIHIIKELQNFEVFYD